ncbi:TlpA disulfide reductase family protein [Rhodanobacter sp. UC4436_H3]
MSLLLVALMSCFAATAGVRPGDVPPDSLGPTMDGHTVSLASLRGKVVVISFWATWCGYCMKEMPVLAKMQSLATERGMSLQVVAVNYKEDRRVFLRAARALGKSLPELLLT